MSASVRSPADRSSLSVFFSRTGDLPSCVNGRDGNGLWILSGYPRGCEQQMGSQQGYGPMPRITKRAAGVAGLVSIASRFGPEETMNRIEAEIRARGLTVFANIDHAACASAVGLSLLPTELLIFGSAAVGTPLMQAAQTMGIDLPLKVLVWQDAARNTWLSYSDPDWLARRHRCAANAAATIEAMATLLGGLAATANGSA